MPLPEDYDSEDGEAAAELAVREAIRDVFVGVATPYLFDMGHSHTAPRFVVTDAEFNDIATVVDPDTADATAENQRRLVRYFHVVYSGHKRGLRELTLNYEIDISMGFKDEYKSVPGLRSYDELTALNMRFGKRLADNQNLGLDGRVSHSFLQCPSKPRWTPVDDQGETTITITNTLAVTLQVC